MENMTIKEIERLITWLELEGNSHAKIIECIRYIATTK